MIAVLKQKITSGVKYNDYETMNGFPILAIDNKHWNNKIEYIKQ